MKILEISLVIQLFLCILGAILNYHQDLSIFVTYVLCSFLVLQLMYMILLQKEDENNDKTK